MRVYVSVCVCTVFLKKKRKSVCFRGNWKSLSCRLAKAFFNWQTELCRIVALARQTQHTNSWTFYTWAGVGLLLKFEHIFSSCIWAGMHVLVSLVATAHMSRAAYFLPASFFLTCSFLWKLYTICMKFYSCNWVGVHVRKILFSSIAPMNLLLFLDKIILISFKKTEKKI
jgi:hypothetical protein